VTSEPLDDPARFARLGAAIESFELGLDALRAGLEAQGLHQRLRLALKVRTIAAKLKSQLREELVP
jgi:hypothetical protein